jgi:hypothetical protein
MPEFILNRDYVMRTTHGHIINFKKGQPTYVPPVCSKDAVALGADAVNNDVDVLGPEPVAVPELSAVDREAKLYAAYDAMIARNGQEAYRTDFNAQGLPSTKPLSALTGFEVTAAERNDSYQKYREAKAAT